MVQPRQGSIRRGNPNSKRLQIIGCKKLDILKSVDLWLLSTNIGSFKILRQGCSWWINHVCPSKDFSPSPADWPTGPIRTPGGPSHLSGEWSDRAPWARSPTVGPKTSELHQLRPPMDPWEARNFARIQRSQNLQLGRGNGMIIDSCGLKHFPIPHVGHH